MKIKTLALTILSLVCATSCSIDSNEGMNSANNTYYTDVNLSGTAQDFATINSAIRNNTLIYTTGYSHNYDHYAAEVDYFYSNGMWRTSDASYGKLRFLPTNGQQMNAIKIVDSNTLIEYSGFLWDPDRVPDDCDIIGRIDTGEIFGTLVYCASPRYFTYIMERNKIIVSNGTIYTKNDSGLIKDGASKPLTKYDPNKSFSLR